MPIKKMTLTEHFTFWGFKALHLVLFVIIPIAIVGFQAWLIGFLTYGLFAGIVLSLVFQLAHTVSDTHFPVPDVQTGKVEDEWAVQHGNIKKTLPKKEFKIVVYLMKNKGRVISRYEMLKNVWEDGVIVGDRTIDVHICKIKRKFPGIPIKLRKCYGYLWQ